MRVPHILHVLEQFSTSIAIRSEAIATRVEAIASRLEAIAIRFQACQKCSEKDQLRLDVDAAATKALSGEASHVSGCSHVV